MHSDDQPIPIEVTEILDPSDISVVRILNPFNPREFAREAMRWESSKTLREYFPLGSVQSVVSINGKVVAQENFERTYLAAGDSLVVCPIPAGGGEGGDGKQILSMVAMIAVAVFAPYAAGALVGATTGIAYSVALAGITMAGSMLVQSMLAPSQKTSNDSEESQSYGYDGAKNTSMEGIVVPVAYGRFRTAGNLIQTHVENDGQSDNQVLYVLINAGEGPISSISDIELNEQPITNYSGAAYQVRLGFNNQPSIDWFANTIVPQTKNLRLTTNFINHTTDVVDKIRLDFVCPNGLWNLDTQTGKNKPEGVQIEIQYKPVGTATWLPMRLENIIIGWREVYYDFSNSVGYTYSDAAGAWFTYVDGQLVWKAPPDAVWRYSDNNQQVTAQDLENIRATNTYYQGQLNAGGIPTGAAQPPQWADPGAPPMPWNADGAVYVPVFTDSFARISSNKKTAVRRSFTSALLPQGAYDVRVRRTTEEDLEDSKKSTAVFLSDINEIQNEPLQYPNTALLAVRIPMGEQLSGMPNITFLHGGKLVSIWGKPDPGAQDMWYAGPSANPAWVVWDMLTNGLYGGGIPSARLDFAAFKRFAAHCETNGLEFNGVFDSEMNVWDASQLPLRLGHAQLVNVGTRWGIVMEAPSTPVMMFSVANMVKDSYKETWLPVSDRATEIDVTYFDKADRFKQRTVKIYDPGALTAGRPSRSSGITLYGVTDGDQAYREGQFQLNLNRFILKTVSFSAPLEAIACTVGDLIYVQHDMPAWAQAGRFEAGSTTSVLKLDRPVTMVAGKAYKVLMLQDRVQRYTGTIASIIGTTVMLNGGFTAAQPVKRLIVATKGKDIRIDEAFNGGVVLNSVAGLAVGDVYTAYDTDVIDEANVVLAVGDTDTITVQAPLAAAPLQFTQWMFGEVERVKQIFRIKSVSGSSDHNREINAIQYDARAYDFSRFPTATAPLPNPNDAILTQVQDLDLYEETRIENSTIKSELIVSWTRPSSGLYKGADVYVKRGEGAFELQGAVEHSFDAEIAAYRGEVISVKVVAYDMANRRVDFAAAPEVTHTVVGEIPAIDVGSVSGITVVWTGKDCRLSWRYNSTTHSYEFGSEPVGADAGALDPHFKDYEIRVYNYSAPPGDQPRRVEWTTDNSYVYTAEKNHTDGLTRRLKFEVRMRDQFNNLGQPATVLAQNLPPQITSLVHNASHDTVGLGWSHNGDIDYAGIMIWMSINEADVAGDITRPGFDSKLVYDGPDSSTVISGLFFNADYYVRAAAYDALGKTELIPTAVPLHFKTTYMDVSAIAEGAIGPSLLIPGLAEEIEGHGLQLEAQGTIIDDLSAKYTVKIDNNGYVTGFGLASTANNGVPTSEFVIRADKFVMTMPGYPGLYPFTIGSVNGSPKVIIQSALIGDASINSLQVADGAITNLKIGGAISSGNWSPGVSGWNIDKSGAASFSRISIYGISPLSVLVGNNSSVTYPHGAGRYPVITPWSPNGNVALVALDTVNVTFRLDNSSGGTIFFTVV